MSDWTAGYVADVGYTYGYYGELNPVRLKLAFLSQGLVFPEVSTACELGFGQGLSIAMHAAASSIEWHGTDFNPSQAGFAKELVNASGARAQLYDEAFDVFANRSDLPQFDFIGLHGIWSWINDDNRGVIVDFIRKKLKIGGVLYISYNTQPGWASFAPMRHLMTQHASIMGSSGQGVIGRVDSALAFAEGLLNSEPIYKKANPRVAERFTQVKSQARSYLAHEYFNRDWMPMYFAEMATWLESAKLQFACSAHLIDHLDALNLTPEQQNFLNEIHNANLRASTRDFMVNQQFRRDYWVRGPRDLSLTEKEQAFSSLRVILVVPRADLSLKVTGAAGTAEMDEKIYNPIMDYLADYNIRTVQQIQDVVRARGISSRHVQQAILVLVSGGYIAVAQEDKVIAEVREKTEKLNSRIILKSRSSKDIGFVSSPVTGGGIALGRFHQLFLLALKNGKRQPAEWAIFLWQLLEAQGERMLSEGVPLETPEENLAELNRRANEFDQKTLPILKALMIV